MFSFNLQIYTPDIVLKKHISVKAADGLSGFP
jgi:hypothetical protein